MINESQKATERVSYEIDFIQTLAARWQAGKQYIAGEYVRPEIANGFEYVAADNGQSDNIEPNWPSGVGSQVVDGSLTWTAAEAGPDSRDSIQSIAVAAETGITVEDSLTGTTARITVSDGVAGKAYDIDVTAITVTNQRYTESLRITVT